MDVDVDLRIDGIKFHHAGWDQQQGNTGMVKSSSIDRIPGDPQSPASSDQPRSRAYSQPSRFDPATRFPSRPQSPVLIDKIPSRPQSPAGEGGRSRPQSPSIYVPTEFSNMLAHRGPSRPHSPGAGGAHNLTPSGSGRSIAISRSGTPAGRTARMYHKSEEEIERETNAEAEKWLASLQMCTAAAKGDVAQLRLLIEERGLDPNACDYDGRTAMHLACEEGHTDAVKYLVTAGANTSMQDRWGSSPMRGALTFDRKEIAEFLKGVGATLGVSSRTGQGQSEVRKAQKIEELQAAFGSLDPTKIYTAPAQTVTVAALHKFLKDRGISYKKHKYFGDCFKRFRDGVMKFANYTEIMADHESLFARALGDKLVIPNWQTFSEEVTEIFEMCRNNISGKVADYIPELAEVDQELWGMSLITKDGQVLHLGDVRTDFPMSSCGKPLLYAFCAEDVGVETIHHYVGREPSGVAFNAFTLNSQKKPHNPFIDSGAIMTSALFHPDMVFSKRFKLLSERMMKVAGGEKIGFNQSVYLSEKSVAHRNYALAHFMESEGGFPHHSDILDTVDFYFQLSSCEVNCNTIANIAATFANNGHSPLSNTKVLSSEIVKNTLQLMYSCGMYDYSGEWACTVGLPAKSSSSGCIYAVIPDVMGIAIYSPRLDDHQNSSRGIEFYRRLVDKFKWNLFDILYSKSDERELQFLTQKAVRERDRA